jgi:hypothetical protein
MKKIFIEEKMRKVYTGKISINDIGARDVFVFGSNLQGFHGAGSAGFASFGVFGNHWREYEYDKKSNGWKGLFNVKGNCTGYQQVNGEIPNKVNLNGYSNRELAELFYQPNIPKNIIFEQNFWRLIEDARTGTRS